MPGVLEAYARLPERGSEVRELSDSESDAEGSDGEEPKRRPKKPKKQRVQRVQRVSHRLPPLKAAAPPAAAAGTSGAVEAFNFGRLAHTIRTRASDAQR